MYTAHNLKVDSYRSSYNYNNQKMTFNRKQISVKTFCFAEDKVPDSPNSCPRGLLEQALCHRLCTVVAALHELSQSALPDGPCTEATLKVTKKMTPGILLNRFACFTRFHG